VSDETYPPRSCLASDIPHVHQCAGDITEDDLSKPNVKDGYLLLVEADNRERGAIKPTAGLELRPAESDSVREMLSSNLSPRIFEGTLAVRMWYQCHSVTECRPTLLMWFMWYDARPFLLFFGSGQVNGRWLY